MSMVIKGIKAGLSDQQICDKINRDNPHRWFSVAAVTRARCAYLEQEKTRKALRKRGDPLTEEDWQTFVDAWHENLDLHNPKVPDENELWLLAFSAARGSDPKADRMHFRNIAALDPRLPIIGLDHVSTVLSEVVWPRYAKKHGLGVKR